MSLILKAYLENEAAIKRFLRRFFPRAQDVEDLAQETFLRAFAAETDQDVHTPRAFLFRVAKNLALDERKKVSRATTDFIEDFADPDVVGSMNQIGVDDAVDSRQVLRLLAQATAALPPQCKEVFVMFRIQGLSHKEIAKSLGISPSTVEKHVASGLLKCAEYLRRHGCDVEHGRLRLKKTRATRSRSQAVADLEQVELRKRTGDE